MVGSAMALRERRSGGNFTCVDAVGLLSLFDVAGAGRLPVVGDSAIIRPSCYAVAAEASLCNFTLNT